MKRRVLMRDVANAAGVSSQTVSRVLNRRSSVRPATRDRVMAAVNALGYQPDLAARSLAVGHTPEFGVLLTERLDHGLASCLAAIVVCAQEAGLGLVLAAVPQRDPAGLAEAMAAFHGHRVQSLIVLGQGYDPLPAPLPGMVGVVLVQDGPDNGRESSTAPRNGPCTVGVDQQAGATVATRHLLDKGRRNIVHLAGDLTWRDAVKRREAFLAATTAADVKSHVVDTHGWSARHGYQAAQRMLFDGAPDAVFAANDEIAIGCARALDQAGLRLPEDVALVGFDDIPLAEYTTPSLTTVCQDFDLLGKEAVAQIRRIMTGEKSQKVTITPKLIVRESST